MDHLPGTRDKILTAAAGIFARKGFEGARVDQIAREAGVNKASIYYNIGNKQVLYEQVLTDVFRQAFALFHVEIEDAVSPEKKLEAYIRQISQALAQQPHIPKILMREQITEGRTMPESLVENISIMLGILDNILEDGKNKRIFETVDTVTIHFMIIGTLAFQMTSSVIRKNKKSFKEKYRPDDENYMGKVTDQVVKSILKAVKKEKD